MLCIIKNYAMAVSNIKVVCFLAICDLESEFHKRQNNLLLGEFEIVTVVVTKNAVFWDIMPCSLLKVNGCLGELSRLRLWC
jgi:hypothetical protein